MSYYINGVSCDTFAHIDSRQVSDTFPFSLSKKIEKTFTTFLYCAGNPFPVSKKHVAQCCIKSGKGYKEVLCLETTSRVIDNHLVPTGFNIKTDKENLSIPDDITSLPNYGHGAGDGYNNTVDFKNGKYIQKCSVFMPKTAIYHNEQLTYFAGLAFDIPLDKYDEYVDAIQTIKCSHSELTFEYYEVVKIVNDAGIPVSSGALCVRLNGVIPSETELQNFIDEQAAAGTPVSICYGRFKFIETDISKMSKIYIAVYRGNDFKGFDGSSCTVGDGLKQNLLANCLVGNCGEIVVLIPDELCTKDEYLSCEITVSGFDEDGESFRYKSASFIVIITE